MDGWESRRKRFEGYDSAVIRLGVPGSINGVDIDTSFFTGNFPAAASLEASIDGETWTEIIPATTLGGNAHHEIAIGQHGPWSWLRLHIYPDGGVARLRVSTAASCSTRR